MKLQRLDACTGYDFMELSQRTVTPEGFLQAPATLARTGVQLYRAREFGLQKYGLDADQIIRVHRPPEEVFDPVSMSSFDGKPVIMEPHENVNADNWKDLAVGDVHSVTRNGNFLAAGKLVIRDKDAIDAIQNGKKFLSNGYTFDLDLTPGTTADGEAYDGIQRNIRGNHVAIVSAPRGGAACRIADSDAVQGEKKMKKLVVNGVPVEVGDSEAGIIESLQTQLEAARNQQPSVTVKVGDASKTITGNDAIMAELSARDAQIVELTSKVLTDDQVNALVSSRVQTIGDACKLVPDFKADGKNDLTIQREVITTVSASDSAMKTVADAVLGGKAVADADASSIAVAFRTILAAKSTIVAASGADHDMANALLGENKTKNATATKLVGRDAFINRSANAWQPEKK